MYFSRVVRDDRRRAASARAAACPSPSIRASRARTACRRKRGCDPGLYCSCPSSARNPGVNASSIQTVRPSRRPNSSFVVREDQASRLGVRRRRAGRGRASGRGALGASSAPTALAMRSKEMFSSWPCLGLGGRREDRLGEPVRLDQALGQRNAADLARTSCTRPSRSPARYPRATHSKGTTSRFRARGRRGRRAASAVGRELGGKAVDVGLEEMVLDVGERPEPEVRELVQDLALVRDAGREHDSRRPRCGRSRRAGVASPEVVELAHLSAAREPARPSGASR